MNFLKHNKIRLIKFHPRKDLKGYAPQNISNIPEEKDKKFKTNKNNYKANVHFNLKFPNNPKYYLRTGYLPLMKT